MATNREDVANENAGPEIAEQPNAPAPCAARLRRGPVELRLPTRAELPPENLDAAYRILVRFVAQHIRRERREEAVNDSRPSGTPSTPSEHEAA